jgi:hypothetical protein
MRDLRMHRAACLHVCVYFIQLSCCTAWKEGGEFLLVKRPAILRLRNLGCGRKASGRAIRIDWPEVKVLAPGTKMKPMFGRRIVVRRGKCGLLRQRQTCSA